MAKSAARQLARPASGTPPPGDSRERALLARIAARRARVGIVGLGYVGLPLACTFAEGGFPVLGVDADAAKVEALTAGRSYIRHLPAARIAALGGRLEPTTDLGLLARCDAILICVPTPLTAARAS